MRISGFLETQGCSMDHLCQVNHSSALNHPKDGLPSTQSSNDALRRMGSGRENGRVHEEMKRGADFRQAVDMPLIDKGP
ncbi:hypothetical protein HAX54_039270 [Datura stramonium]|uniref:Uncharacterized protein n=1 Tax=Datura stramonium TaxID=4076 RepID=A0ABS8SIR4_DATST|nr:hypothetical protein [Datura stramonium]